MKSLQGHLLVASPHLPDPNFFRTIVLMVQHNEQGAFGLVLNRPSNSTLKDIWKQVTDEPCQDDQPILLGGPLPGPLMAVHTKASCSEDQIRQGIYFATQKDNVMQIVGHGAQPYRIFSGYAGWAGGQLEHEMEVGGWLTTPATFDYIFHPLGDDIWKKVVSDIGGEIVLSSLKIKEVPDDPSVN